MLFDFNSAPLHSPLPLDLTVAELTAHLSATGKGFSIQEANVLGFTPVGFSGHVIYPNSVFAADLMVAFSQSLTSFSSLYAPEELATDSSARMRVTRIPGWRFCGNKYCDRRSSGHLALGNVELQLRAGLQRRGGSLRRAATHWRRLWASLHGRQYVGHYRPRTSAQSHAACRPWAPWICSAAPDAKSPLSLVTYPSHRNPFGGILRS